jgi:hypothetical protein
VAVKKWAGPDQEGIRTGLGEAIESCFNFDSVARPQNWSRHPECDPTVGMVDSCVRAASGHAATAPAVRMMNLRRVIRCPRPRTTATPFYRRAVAYSNVSWVVNGANFRSSPGSGLKSDIAMSEKAPEADMAMGLFDHLVGASKNARRDDRILTTKFVPNRRVAGGSPRLVASTFCPLPYRQLHKYQPAGLRDARVNHHNLLIVHVTRYADRPCRRCRAGLVFPVTCQL